MAELFEKAAATVSEFGKAGNQLTQEDQLNLYGLFKQAKLGNATGSRPGVFSPTERTKWDAWNANKDKSQEAAAAEYVDVARRLLPAEWSSRIN
jgi:diazepam-binding inhibitor (GABA receptor modulating acyl-CoA-binding protein)